LSSAGQNAVQPLLQRAATAARQGQVNSARVLCALGGKSALKGLLQMLLGGSDELNKVICDLLTPVVREMEAKEQGIEVEVVRYPWAASGRAQALGRTEGFTKLLIDPDTERILGIGIVGINAGDILTEGVVAIEMGATARDVGESIHPHPTLSETIGNAAETFLGTATEIYRPRPASKS